MTLDARPLREVPLAVIDFETTGLSPKGGARVVEIAVVRALPGRKPEVVLDSLVDPDGRCYARAFTAFRMRTFSEPQDSPS